MRDLSDLDVPLIRYLLPHILIGDPGLNRKEALYRRNFVRLVDKAVSEYQWARFAIVQEVEEAQRPAKELEQEGRRLHILQFIDHFENCLNAINRLLQLIERIKSERISQNIPRSVRRSIEAYSKSIPDIRNAIEHMDEWIQKDEISEGQPVMLGIGEEGDRAIIGGYYIEFTDVAVTLNNLHKVALALLDVEKDKPVGNHLAA